jgi:hypothetical protein
MLLAFLLATAAAMLTVGAIAALGGVMWQYDGVAVCTASNPQSDPKIVPDGTGGAVVVWKDTRSSLHGLYAQRVDGDGTALWTADGVTLSLPSGTYVADPRIAPDGSGGAVVAWPRTGDGYDIYAQRVYSDGTLAWSPTTVGVGLCTEAGGQLWAQIVSDGAGGGIAAWRDGRDDITTDNDIYVQRVYSNGVVAWTADGVSLCVAAGDQEDLQIASDGAGGAIAVWKDERDLGTTAQDIYVRRVDANGNALWAADGVSLCATSGAQVSPKIASDGSGGAFVTWQDSATADIYAQRVLPDGTMAWPTGGVSVCTANLSQNQPDIAPDGAGGALLVWQDGRPGSNDTDIYAQRIDSSGNSLWQTDGVTICRANYNQRYPKITSDGFGGAVVTWWDYRSNSDYDVYAQRVSASGNVAWYTDGVTVCAASGDQDEVYIVTDGFWGAIIAWEDSRGDDDDIYAQRVGTFEVVNLPLVVKNH